MKIAIGADHGGFLLKAELVTYLEQTGHTPGDLGTFSGEAVDYPDYSRAVAQAVRGQKADRGILICGSGVGASVAANKFPGIRAAVCHDTFSVRQGVEDDDMNVLCLGARVIDLELAKELIAYGFDPRKTYFIIDQIYTNIYNLAVKLSKKINLSEIKATYGYKNEENIGLHFYPAVQAAHILFPQEKHGIKNVLVPIGPDEDAHIRISRDVARKEGYNLPSILHIFFLPGTDGEKMSKSRNNAIFLRDSTEEIRKKVNKAFSGGRDTEEEQRRLGAMPEKDVSLFYLTKLFLNEKESEKLIHEYKTGKILSKDVKHMLTEELIRFTHDFQEKLKKVNIKDLEKSILRNE